MSTTRERTDPMTNAQPTPETRTIDLAALATELEAAGIPVLVRNGYLYIDTLNEWTIDIFTDGDVYVGETKLDTDAWTALGIVQRHIAATEGCPPMTTDEANLTVTFTCAPEQLTPTFAHECRDAVLDLLTAIADDKAPGAVRFEPRPIEWIDDGKNEVVVHVRITGPRHD
jgi:hypothetical protein